MVQTTVEGFNHLQAVAIFFSLKGNCIEKKGRWGGEQGLRKVPQKEDNRRKLNRQKDYKKTSMRGSKTYWQLMVSERLDPQKIEDMTYGLLHDGSFS